MKVYGYSMLPSNFYKKIISTLIQFGIIFNIWLQCEDLSKSKDSHRLEVNEMSIDVEPFCE